MMLDCIIENKRDRETLKYLEYVYTAEELKIACDALKGQRKRYLSNIVKELKAEIPEEILQSGFDNWKYRAEESKRKILSKFNSGILD